MHSKNRTLVLVMGLLFMILVSAIVYVFAVSNEKGSEMDYEYINIYFTNATTNVLESEKRNIPISNTYNEKISNVFREYLNGPKNTNLSPISTKIDIRDVVTISYPYGSPTAVAIKLTEKYNDLPASRRMLLISSLAYTFTDLDFINNVYIITYDDNVLTNINGEKLEGLNATNLLNNPSFVPEKVNRNNVILYFSNGYRLAEEDRSIQVKQSQTTEYQIVEQLITGPYDSDLKACIPADTKIRDIKTEEGICYVNLSADFITKASQDERERLLAIYSIVNSLTELDSINKVQFLIEGEKVTGFQGHADFSKTYERNEEYISGK